jgi:hypothetical protein
MDIYLHSPNTPSRCGAQLKHRDNFTFLPLWYRMDSSGSGQDPVADFCEHGHEFSDSIKGVKFLD